MRHTAAGNLTLTPEQCPTRRMRRIAPLVLRLGAACIAGPATLAFGQSAAVDTARLQRFLPIARAAWPGSPCAGRESIHVAAATALRGHETALAGPAESLNGMAEPDTCEVWLASGMSAR